MRATLGLLFVAVITVAGVIALSDATKFEGGVGSSGSTEVVFSVDAQNYHHDLEDAAASLWYACVNSVGWETSTAPALLSGHRYLATIGPALPEDSRRRFRGCLEDATVDKVRGNVVAMHQLP